MRVVLIGLGNPYRRDDAAGIEVARRLRDSGLPGVEVTVYDGEPLGLLDLWAGADLVYVVDAVAGEGPPGTVHRFEVDDEPVPDRPRRDSTHAVSLGQAVELARAMGRLPRRLVLMGIEGADFRAGVGLTPAVSEAVAEVADSLAQAASEMGGRF